MRQARDFGIQHICTKGFFRNIFDVAILDRGLIFSLSFPQLPYSGETVHMQRLV